MKVRRLGPGDDVEAANALLGRFFREGAFATPDDVIAARTRQMAGIETCGLFLAEADGLPIGVATVSMEFGIEYGWSAEMGDLYVVPERRGRGVSRRLIEAVEDLLSSRGAAGYQVTVTPRAQARHDLRAYYGKFGFADEGRTILYRSLDR